MNTMLFEHELVDLGILPVMDWMLMLPESLCVT